MTTIDMYTEQRMRANEFSNIIAKYRNQCKVTKLKGIIPTAIEESRILLDNLPTIENLVNPIYNIIQIVKSGTSKFKDDIKSVKNVLKMVAGLM